MCDREVWTGRSKEFWTRDFSNERHGIWAFLGGICDTLLLAFVRSTSFTSGEQRKVLRKWDV